MHPYAIKVKDKWRLPNIVCFSRRCYCSCRNRDATALNTWRCSKQHNLMVSVLLTKLAGVYLELVKPPCRDAITLTFRFSVYLSLCVSRNWQFTGLITDSHIHLLNHTNTYVYAKLWWWKCVAELLCVCVCVLLEKAHVFIYLLFRQDPHRPPSLTQWNVPKFLSLQ